MNDLLDTLRDIARTACEHDATLLNRIRHPDEDAEYYSDQEELDNQLERERQNWWLQQDMDEAWLREQDADFAEYQEDDR